MLVVNHPVLRSLNLIYLDKVQPISLGFGSRMYELNAREPALKSMPSPIILVSVRYSNHHNGTEG